ARVLSVRAFDKAKEDSIKLKSQQDSVRRDSLLADSLRKVKPVKPDSAPPRPPAQRTTPTPRPRRTDIPQAVSRALGRDTTKNDSLPKPTIAPPISEVVIQLGQPLKAASAYRLRTVSLRSFLGHERSAMRSFTLPKERKVADSTGADSEHTRRDTTRRDTTRREPPRPARVPRDTMREAKTSRRDASKGGAPNGDQTANAYIPLWLKAPDDSEHR
ncbi:MAG: hypothetical protein ABIT38_04290, partial [Gemmatimonadaceae bacterium]